MLFSICTATFNRAHTLARVFDSLQAQSEKKFEWIVIDDGSVDDTAAIVEQFIQISMFEIRYLFQENQGKHVALNKGIAMAKGKFFLVADSDDELMPNSLAIFHKYWLGIPMAERNKYTGVTGLCIDKEGHVIGDRFPSEIFDSNSLEIFYRHRILGEKWGFHRTKVLKEFPIPELSGLSFYSEGLIWNAISRRYKTRFINKVVRIYHQNEPDRLSLRNNKTQAKHMIFYVSYLNNDSDYLFIAPLRFAKTAARGIQLSLHCSENLNKQLKRLKTIKLRCLWVVCFPIGLVLYLLDKLPLNNK